LMRSLKWISLPSVLTQFRRGGDSRCLARAVPRTAARAGSRSACCPQEEQRAADPAVGGAVGIVTPVRSRRRVPHVGTPPPGSGSALSETPGAGVCSRQPGKLAATSAGTASHWRHSVPPTAASVALSAG
jgi:hypothetical protein